MAVKKYAMAVIGVTSRLVEDADGEYYEAAAKLYYNMSVVLTGKSDESSRMAKGMLAS